MLIVSDTSPISNLLIIHRLDLLRKIYKKIIIPGSVMTELLELEKFNYDLTELKSAKWIEVISVVNKNEINSLLTEIDLGEAEAIALAKQLRADWLLMDETIGRSIARKQGLNVIGLLGVLLEAKRLGELASVKTIVDELIQKAKFRVNKKIYQEILELANEK